MSVASMSVLSIEPARPAALPLQTAARAESRLALLDTVRLVAAVGIVWVHAAQSDAGNLLHPIGTFGVPFYTFAAVLFMARTLTKPGGRSLGGYVASRFGRIYMPFLFWSAVYVLLGEAKSIVETHTFHPPSPIVLYAGGHAHLWFLPYLMVVTIFGACVVRGTQGRPVARRATAAVFVGLGILSATIREPAWVSQRPLDFDFWQYAIRAAPTVFWAIALALVTVVDGRLPRTNLRIAVGGAALLVFALVLQEAVAPFKVLRSLAGLGCVMVALMPLASAATARVGTLGRHSYGIYLSHVVFLRLIAAVYAHYGLPPTLATDAVAFVFAFACASALSVLLSMSPWTRWTLGE